MKRMAIVLPILFLGPPAGAADPPATADPGSLEGSLEQTELAFAASLYAGDFEKFISFIAEDAVFVSSTTLRGPEAIGEAWKGFFEPGAAKLVWKPCRVAVNEAGELGLSSGPYWIEGGEDPGEGQLLQGTFFSIWRHQEDGSWKIIFDSGTEAALGPAEAADCK